MPLVVTQEGDKVVITEKKPERRSVANLYWDFRNTGVSENAAIQLCYLEMVDRKDLPPFEPPRPFGS
jgi:hypothetical protein